MSKSAAALALIAILGVRTAHAQGHRGAPPGLIKHSSTSSSSSSSSPANSSAGTSQGPAVTTPLTDVTPRSFGTWLDDATLADSGAIWLTMSAMRWTSPVAHGVDAPSFAVAAGLGTRTQLSLAVPVSRVIAGDVASFDLGDVYGGLKIQLVAPAQRRAGISVTPTIEILNSSTTRRAHVVLPASLEFGSNRTRVYGSTGWFSRGAIFLAGAVERHLSDRVAVTAALLQSWATSDASRSLELGLNRSRTDVNGMASAFVGPSVAVFGGISRTISPAEFDSSTFVAFGGVALQVTPAASVPIRVPR